MGLWGGIKGIGRWVGDEARRVVAPIGSAIEGDWKGALSGIGRNVKRAGQAGALFGKDKLAGVDVGLLGAGGGAIEGGLGPSEVGQYLGDTGGGGFAGAAGGALKGYGGVQVGKGLHNIGERLGINERLGALTNKVVSRPSGPSVRREGETDEAFVDRLQRRKYDEQLMNTVSSDALPEWDPSLSAQQNHDNRNFARRQARFEALANVVREDPRTIKIGEQYYGGYSGPGDLSPGSGGSNFIDRAIGEETARLDKWNRENVPAAPDLGDLSIPEDVIDPRSYMNAPGAVPTPASAQENMNAQAARSALSKYVRANQARAIMPNVTDRSIPEIVIDPSSYMTPPAAVGPPVSARENMNAQGAVPAARFGASAAPGDVEIVGGPVYSSPLAPGGYSPMPDASNIARATEDAGRVTGGGGMGANALMRNYNWNNPINLRGAGRVTGGGGVDDSDRKWWQKGLDYAGEHPDAIALTVGAMMANRGQDDYYRRRAAIDEDMMRLRREQEEEDKKQFFQQLYLRGSTSKWA